MLRRTHDRSVAARNPCGAGPNLSRRLLSGMRSLAPGSPDRSIASNRVMLGLVLFNLVVMLFCAAILGRLVPKRYYGFLRGLHGAIGITTPTDSQLGWVMVAWILSMAAIVDVLAFVMSLIMR